MSTTPVATPAPTIPATSRTATATPTASPAASAPPAWVQALVRRLAADAIGLGFGGAAVYGLVTGRIVGGGLTTAIALAAFYLGFKTTPPAA